MTRRTATKILTLASEAYALAGFATYIPPLGLVLRAMRKLPRHPYSELVAATRGLLEAL